jgi:hypothetical protein
LDRQPIPACEQARFIENQISEGQSSCFVHFLNSARTHPI